jgi:hypothetical protein
VRPYLEKNPSRKGLMVWLKVKALSLSPSTAKKKKKKRFKVSFYFHLSLWSHEAGLINL